jgi:O-acetyl-ADP-ribose deacetylase (regulator of RNase III)
MVKVIQGDITTIKVDAIVNAANIMLIAGGGLDGAIRQAGGIIISEECDKIRKKQGGCLIGEAVITSAGNLPSRFVIHAVGPIWKGGNRFEDQFLSNAYRNSLQIAIDNKVETISFPNISTGTYHYPKELAAKIAISTVYEFIKTNNEIKDVTFVCFDDENFNIYKTIFMKFQMRQIQI